jgi:hypothetical protein
LKQRDLIKKLEDAGFSFERHYDTELLARGISPDRIRHYGFAFEGKTVLIG